MVEKGTNVGVDVIKQISLLDPILALLLLVLLAGIYFMYRTLNKKETIINTLQTQKATEVKELNEILLKVREADKEMLVELKNILVRFIELKKEQNELLKNNIDEVESHTNLLIQISTKIELLLNTKKV